MKEDYNKLMQMVANKNSVTYSSIAKKSESLELGGMTIVPSIIEKRFLFKSGMESVNIDMNDKSINVDKVGFGDESEIIAISDEEG